MELHKFKDSDNSIIWNIIPSLNQVKNNETICRDFINDYKSTLNQWQDQGISDFIVDGKPLGDHIKSILTGNEGEYVGCFAVTKSGKPIAYLLLGPDKNPDTLIIHHAVVSSKHRGKHLARKMINSLQNNLDEFTSSKDILYLQAQISNTNIPSQKAFLKCGFKKILSPHKERREFEEKDPNFCGIYRCSLAEIKNQKTQNEMSL